MKKDDTIITLCYNSHNEIFGKHRGKIIKKENFKNYRCEDFEKVEKMLKKAFDIFSNKKLHLITNVIETDDSFGKYGILTSVEYDLNIKTRTHKLNSNNVELYIKDKRMDYLTGETMQYMFPIVNKTIGKYCKDTEFHIMSEALIMMHPETPKVVLENKNDLRELILKDFLETKMLLAV